MSRAETTAMLSKLVEKRLKNRVSFWASEVNFDLGTSKTDESTSWDSSRSRPAMCSCRQVWNLASSPVTKSSPAWRISNQDMG